MFCWVNGGQSWRVCFGKTFVVVVDVVTDVAVAVVVNFVAIVEAVVVNVVVAVVVVFCTVAVDVDGVALCVASI